MNRKCTIQERVFALQMWWRHKHSSIVRRLFQKKIPNTRPLTRQAIYNLHKRFETTGTVADLPQSGRPRTSRSQVNL